MRSQLLKGVEDLHTYVERNREFVPNYGERYRNGEKIASGFVRQFDGRLLHQLRSVRTSHGDAYMELYVTELAEPSRVALYRSGTRVVEVLGSLPGLEHAPWTSSYLEGLIDVPFLNVTPDTRSGIIHDERYAALCEALRPLEEDLNALIAEQQRAIRPNKQPMNVQMQAITGVYVF